MKTFILSISFIFLISFSSFAQNCNCKKEFQFVVSYLEANLPSFTDNVKSNNRPQYERFKKTLAATLSESMPATDCYRSLVSYVEYFKDNHTMLFDAKPAIDESDPLAVEKFFKSPLFVSWEKIALGSPIKFDASDPIEGYYTTGSASYTVAVVKNKNSYRDYVGVIESSTSKLWPKGQVKFELKKTENGLDGFFYYRNYTTVYQQGLQLKNGRLLGTSWQKKSSEDSAVGELIPSDMDFKLINDSVAYLRIPTFNGQLYAQLDSLYKLASPTIYKTPYLIIDVRGNGGGSDSNVEPLIPFIYAEPMVFDERVDYYVTKDNIEKYEEYISYMKDNIADFGEESVNYMAEEVEKLKKAELNTFLPMDDSQSADTIKIDASEYPKKVGILYDRGCASSCETLLFVAQKSSKTILMGDNSGGYVGYGNVFSTDTPYGFKLQTSTTRYSTQRKYEVIGIAPDHYLSSSNWLDEAMKKLTE